MKKIICDFCGKETNDTMKYTLPYREKIKAWNGMGVVFAEFGYETFDKNKDVCPECQEKIALLLELMPKCKVVKNGDNTNSLLLNIYDE